MLVTCGPTDSLFHLPFHQITWIPAKFSGGSEQRQNKPHAAALMGGGTRELNQLHGVGDGDSTEIRKISGQSPESGSAPSMRECGHTEHLMGTGFMVTEHDKNNSR